MPTRKTTRGANFIAQERGLAQETGQPASFLDAFVLPVKTGRIFYGRDMQEEQEEMERRILANAIASNLEQVRQDAISAIPSSFVRIEPRPKTKKAREASTIHQRPPKRSGIIFKRKDRPRFDHSVAVRMYPRLPPNK